VIKCLFIISLIAWFFVIICCFATMHGTKVKFLHAHNQVQTSVGWFWEKKSSSPKWEEQEEPINDTDNSENRIWVLRENLSSSPNIYIYIWIGSHNLFLFMWEPKVGSPSSSHNQSCQPILTMRTDLRIESRTGSRFETRPTLVQTLDRINLTSLIHVLLK